MAASIEAVHTLDDVIFQLAVSKCNKNNLNSAIIYIGILHRIQWQ